MPIDCDEGLIEIVSNANSVFKVLKEKTLAEYLDSLNGNRDVIYENYFKSCGN